MVKKLFFEINQTKTMSSHSLVVPKFLEFFSLSNGIHIHRKAKKNYLQVLSSNATLELESPIRNSEFPSLFL